MVEAGAKLGEVAGSGPDKRGRAITKTDARVTRRMLHWSYGPSPGKEHDGLSFNEEFVRHVNEGRMTEVGTPPRLRGLFVIGYLIKSTGEVQPIRVGHGPLLDRLAVLLQSTREQYPNVDLVATCTSSLAEANFDDAVDCLINKLRPIEQPEKRPDKGLPYNAPRNWRTA